MATRAVEKLGYRACVGVMLLDRRGRVWVGHRPDTPDEEGAGQWWQMPQGGIDAGEDPKTAAVRELREETGVKSAEVIAEAPEWYHYDLPPHLIGKSWGGRYRGQKQRWFALRFLGDDREIDLAPDGLKPEFDRWRWAAMDELETLIVPFKRKVYREVVREFRHLATPEKEAIASHSLRDLSTPSPRLRGEGRGEGQGLRRPTERLTNRCCAAAIIRLTSPGHPSISPQRTGLQKRGSRERVGTDPCPAGASPEHSVTRNVFIARPGPSRPFRTYTEESILNPFSELQLSGPLLKALAAEGYRAHSHPAPRHPRAPEGPRSFGHRPDRHRQDGGLRAAHPRPAGRHPSSARAPHLPRPRFSLPPASSPPRSPTASAPMGAS